MLAFWIVWKILLWIIGGITGLAVIVAIWFLVAASKSDFWR